MTSQPLRQISAVSVVVRDYDPAIDFYVGRLGFDLIEDTDLGDGKRWVLVAPRGGQARLLLAKAVTAEQEAAIGHQTGGRVFLFLQTDDFARDHSLYLDAGIRFTEPPRHEAYGIVAVFEDPFGNRWDLIQPA